MLAVFHDTAAVAQTGLELQSVLAAQEKTRALRLRVGIHRGPVMAATLNDHLDYFGSTVGQALKLPFLARGEVIISAAVMAYPQVVALLRVRSLHPELL